MILSRKAAFVQIVTFLSLIVVLFGASQLILLGGFETLEEQTARENVNRVQNSITDEFERMLSTNADWGQWTDTYEFVSGNDDTYIDDNFPTPGTLIALDLTFMIFTDSSGTPIYAPTIDHQTGEFTSLPVGMERYLAADSLLLIHPDKTSSHTGIVQLAEGPVLLTSQPILTSEGQGPSPGTLILGRYLDEDKLAEIAREQELTIQLYSLENDVLPTDIAEVSEDLAHDAVAMHTVDKNQVKGYGTLTGIDGEAVLLYEVVMARDIVQQGRESITFFIVFLLLSGVIAGGAGLIGLRQFVLKPLATLSRDVNSITTRQQFSSRVNVPGQDEIGSLAANINAMLVALEQANKKLDQANRLKSELLSNMSHELRTPLNAIMGYTSMLIEDTVGQDNNGVKAMLERIEENGDRLLTLVNKILDLNKLEAGQLEIIKEPVSMAALVSAWDARFQILAASKQLTFSTIIAPDFPPLIYADADRLTQLVNNLLANAIKFTRQGSIQLKLKADGTHWTLEVEDTGIGISPDDQDIIFAEFHQISSGTTRQYEGTGLGLALVRRLTQAMGGSIQVHSELGKGSTFIITLPLELVTGEFTKARQPSA